MSKIGVNEIRLHHPATHVRARGNAFHRDLPVTLLLVTFFCFSALWALRIPVPTQPPDKASYFNPDEWNHIAVIDYLATHRQLPPFTFQYNTSVHPPLYHALGALVYGPVRSLAGYTVAVLVLRLLSCLISTAVVWFAYRTARHLLSRSAALLAAGCVAGVPTFVSLSGAVNNENLATLAAAAALYTMVAGIRRGFYQRRVLALSLWTAVGIATKMTCLGLLPTAFVALWLAGRRQREAPGQIMRQMLVVLGVSIVFMGWWFVRNQVVYGDPLRQAVERAMWRNVQPGYQYYVENHHVSPLVYLMMITFTGWHSFWGQFDSARAALHERAYLFLSLLRVAAMIGVFSLWLRGKLRAHHIAAGCVMAFFWAFEVFGFCAYNWTYYAPQGRNLFPLLLPLGIVTAAGWRALFPPSLRRLMSILVLVVLLLLNLNALITIPARRITGSNISLPLQR